MSKLSIVNGECDHGDGNDNGYADVDGNGNSIIVMNM